MQKTKLEQGIVREMIHEDLSQVLEWRNHIDVRKYMFSQKEITVEEHHNWFNKASQNDRIHLLIYELEGVSCGLVNFNLRDTTSLADWGFYLAPHAVRGTGQKLGTVGLNFAFEKLGLHKVCGEALAFNDRSIKFHLNLGFKEEGILREQFFDGENYHNIICFGLLVDEWKQNSQGNS